MKRFAGCLGSLIPAAIFCSTLCGCAPGGASAPSNAAQASAPTNQAAVVTAAAATAPTAVTLESDNGNVRVPVLINNAVYLKFTIDSGASDVTIPADVASTLVRSGTITREDFIGYETFQLADGSTVPSPLFRIRSLKVGGLELHNIVAALSNQNGSLLLGQSFLSRVSSWSIDNQRHVLLLGAPKADQTVTSAPMAAGDAGDDKTVPEPPSEATSQAASEASANAATRVQAYFAAWSGDDASPAAVRPFYAPVINFYGAQLGIESLMGEKISFAARWPARTYTVREPSVSSTCEDEHTCLVQGIVDWVDSNPMTGRQSSGAAEFSFVLRDGLIIAENGKVISRG